MPLQSWLSKTALKTAPFLPAKRVHLRVAAPIFRYRVSDGAIPVGAIETRLSQVVSKWHQWLSHNQLAQSTPQSRDQCLDTLG